MEIENPPSVARANVKGYLDAPGRGLCKVYVFDSPKCGNRLVIYGEVCFWHLIMAEGNPHVLRYILPRFDEGPINIRQYADVHLDGGDIERWHFSERSKKKKFSGELPSILKTAYDIAEARCLPLNWKILCAFQNRARGRFLEKESAVLRALFRERSSIQLDALINQPGADQGSMFAVLARKLALGSLETDLRTRMLSRQSVITQVQS